MTSAPPGGGLPTARVFLVGEAWGEAEERSGIPFVGASGQLLDNLLREAGLSRSECYVSNLVNARPPYNDLERWIPKKAEDRKAAAREGWPTLRGKVVHPLVQAGFESLLREINLVKPRVIVALGGWALWALAGATGILKWRGSQIWTQEAGPRTKLIPTVHPAAVLREMSLRPTVVVDLKRAARERDTPPERYSNEPEWNFIIRPSFKEATGVLTFLLGVANGSCEAEGRMRTGGRPLVMERGKIQEGVRLCTPGSAEDAVWTSSSLDSSVRSNSSGPSSSPQMSVQTLHQPGALKACDEQGECGGQAVLEQTRALDRLECARSDKGEEESGDSGNSACRGVWTSLENHPGDLQANYAKDALWIDFDLETKAGHIDCAGISWSRAEALCLPFMSMSNREGYWSLEEEAYIVWLLYKLLTHKNVRVRGQNLLYDAQYTYRWWHFVPRVAQDTMIAFHSCFAGQRKSLDFQASLFCDYYTQWKPDKQAWKEGG